MTNDNNEPYTSPFRKTAPKQRVPGERLWTLTKDGQRRYADQPCSCPPWATAPK
ncbi:MAG: hypothetical protein ABMA15_10405 [Vicinamibacterales bacterium]